MRYILEIANDPSLKTEEFQFSHKFAVIRRNVEDVRNNSLAFRVRVLVCSTGLGI
jgi:hypothetical protein